MTARLGISISAGAVRGVLIRSGRVAWHDAVIGEPASLETTLSDLLQRVPKSSIRRSRAMIAVGLAHSQVKPIDGIPAAAALTVLNRVVRENAAAFFLCGGRRLVVTDVDRRTDGSVWAAAFDPDVVDAAVAALKHRGITKISATPSVVAVASIIPPGIYCLVEGSVCAEITTMHGTIVAHVRRAPGPAHAQSIPLPSKLESLGPQASEFAAAFGAALTSATAGFVWRPAPSAQRSRTVARARVLCAALLLTSSLAGALAAPSARVTVAARTAGRELPRTRTKHIEAKIVDAELRRVSAELDRLEQFDASRGAITLLLGAIAQALPESTALVNLRVDSLEGSFIALSPRVTDILPLLADVDGVVAPRIVGSVTRESHGAVRLQRATFRFARPRQGSR